MKNFQIEIIVDGKKHKTLADILPYEGNAKSGSKRTPIPF